MATRSLSKQEKEWRAEDDARAMKRYMEIQNDKERLKTATDLLEKEAKQIASVLDDNYKATGII